jgi:dihydrolipoamide dehydrogenase
MKKNTGLKILLLLIIISAIWAFRHYNLGQYLTFDYLKANKIAFEEYYTNNNALTLTIYFLIYIASTALSLPGATILTLAGGALFGMVTGLIIVSFASTIGATLAFLISRFFLKDWVQEKFGSNLEAINEGIKKDGAFYLFTIRLIPLFPFFLVNLAMGLTPIKTITYFLVSQIGMLGGTIVYVNAGTQLGNISSPSEILSLKIILSFAALGIFPLVAKKIVETIKAKRVYKGFKKPKNFDYNMVAIGAGSAGLVTSYISAAVKARVALIEKNAMGGDCLNTGCVPSKAILRTAKMVHHASEAKKYGLDSMEVKFEFSKVMDRVKNVIKKIEPHDSVERYTSLGVECIQGEAEIISPWEVKVGERVLTTKNITIATGASPLVVPFPGLDKIDYLTSDNLWDLKELPEKFLVLGGGPIGCEMAQAFARLGSKVSIVEMLPRIMAVEDEAVSDFITEKFKKEGINILADHKAKEFLVEDGRNYLITKHNGSEVKVEFDKVLLAMGRRANVNGFGLENLDITLRSNGTIEADQYLRTNYPNIFVCGDVTGPFQFTHTASHQAWYCAVNGLFGKFKKFKVDYSVIPWCTFTDPEVASVGLSEFRAKAQNVPYELITYGIDDLDRAIADSEDQGLVRVLVKPGTDKIIGATILGNHASDLLLEFISAMKNKVGLNSILGTIHIYPTMGEANKYLAGNWKRTQGSEKIFNFLTKFHKWMRN